MKVTERYLVKELERGGYPGYCYWFAAIAHFAYAQSPESLTRFQWFVRSFKNKHVGEWESSLDKKWQTSYTQRFSLLRKTDSGQQLIAHYDAYVQADWQVVFTEQQKKDHEQIMTGLWILAHQEAGFLQDAKPILHLLGETAEESLELLCQRLKAEREAESQLFVPNIQPLTARQN